MKNFIESRIKSLGYKKKRTHLDDMTRIMHDMLCLGVFNLSGICDVVLTRNTKSTYHSECGSKAHHLDSEHPDKCEEVPRTSKDGRARTMNVDVPKHAHRKSLLHVRRKTKDRDTMSACEGEGFLQGRSL